MSAPNLSLYEDVRRELEDARASASHTDTSTRAAIGHLVRAIEILAQLAEGEQ